MRSLIPSSAASTSASSRMRTAASSSSPSQSLRPRACFSFAAATVSSRTLSSLPSTAAAKGMARGGAFRSKLKRLDSIATSASSSDDEAAATSTSTSSSNAKDDDDLWIEQELRRRKKSRGPKGKGGGGPNVIAPAVSRAKGETAAKPADGAEAAALQFLGAFFFVLLLEGLALAASGFFPENVDAFITERIYPSYSPQLGAFLLCSSLYGLWKSKQN